MCLVKLFTFFYIIKIRAVNIRSQRTNFLLRLESRLFDMVTISNTRYFVIYILLYNMVILDNFLNQSVAGKIETLICAYVDRAWLMPS